MLDFPRWKTVGISIILLLGILFSICLLYTSDAADD